MASLHVPDDFKEFLKLLESKKVSYLLIGGYAVGFHGYARTTADMDIWIARTRANAMKTSRALRDFGFPVQIVQEDLFLKPDQIIRMGLPPLRLEILTSISGVEFADCYRRRIRSEVGGIQVSIISLTDLHRNKQASGRAKGLDDLEHLPKPSA